jgi:hypothetical protein
MSAASAREAVFSAVCNAQTASKNLPFAERKRISLAVLSALAMRACDLIRDGSLPKQDAVDLLQECIDRVNADGEMLFDIKAKEDADEINSAVWSMFDGVEEPRHPDWWIPEFDREMAQAAKVPNAGDEPFKVFNKWGDAIVRGIREYRIDPGIDVVAEFSNVATKYRGNPDDPQIKRVLDKLRKALQERQRFGLIQFDDWPYSQENTDIVYDLLPERGIVVVWGPPKCGKSFWIVDLALHIALGWEYRGRRVRQCPVIYFALEGRQGVPKRQKAFKLEHADRIGGQRVPFWNMRDNINLPKDQAALITAFRKKFANGYQRPGIIIIDTLNRSIDGSENEPADMSKYLAAASALEQAFECLVIVVHHCGIDESRMRGHTSLRGNIDVQIKVMPEGNTVVEPMPDGTVRRTKHFKVTVVEAKDMAEGDVIACKLETRKIGEDKEGKPIYSSVVLPVEGDVPDYGDENKKTKVSKEDRAWNESLLRGVLHSMRKDAWRIVYPYQNKSVGENAVEYKAVWQQWRDSRGDEDKDAKPGSVQRAFNREITRYQGEQRIGLGTVEGVKVIWLGAHKEQARKQPDPAAYAAVPNAPGRAPERCPICGEAKSGCSSCNAEMRAAARAERAEIPDGPDWVEAGPDEPLE